MFAEAGSNTLKLGDFGLAKLMDGRPAKTPCGTQEYMVRATFFFFFGSFFFLLSSFFFLSFFLLLLLILFLWFFF